MTAIERLLGAPAGTPVRRAIDLLVTDDWTTPALRAPLQALGTTRAASPLVLVHDHTYDPGTYQGEERERAVRLLHERDAFVGTYDATLLAREGIQHHVLPAAGYVRPGDVVVGNDSHAPTLGAFGAAAFAAQPTTFAACMHTGHLPLVVPHTVGVELRGRLAPGVSARDAMLTLLSRLRDDGTGLPVACGRALEFHGAGVASLSASERAVLANAAPEATAITAVFTPDARTATPAGEAGTFAALRLDLDRITPRVARGGSASDVVALDDLAGDRVDQVFVGTCSGGTVEEIAAFAEALGARTRVPAWVAPASREVARRLDESGVLARLVRAGVTVLPPGCGPCFGFGPGRLGPGARAVTTGNRNAAGRMGAADAEILLASGRTAGRAARTGRLGATGAGGRGTEAGACAPSRSRPGLQRPRHGNALLLHGTVTTDDLTPSAVPGVGTSADGDPAVLRRLLFHHLLPESARPQVLDALDGGVVLADGVFGVGSNRASSVRALRAAGVQAVVARGVAPVYLAGARDEGLPVLTLAAPDAFQRVAPDSVVRVDPDAGRVWIDGHAFEAAPPPAYDRALYRAGGVLAYLQPEAEPTGVAR
ncbi:MAG: aconitase family protein [Trueperaceae bacterium]|nr:aconitase family protein [Trueperaceae bacterium]